LTVAPYKEADNHKGNCAAPPVAFAVNNFFIGARRP